MDPINKQMLLENIQLKYKEMEALKKIFLEKSNGVQRDGFE